MSETVTRDTDTLTLISLAPPACPKCLTYEWSVHYQADSHNCRRSSPCHDYKPPGHRGCCDFEHMHRRCQMCGFVEVYATCDSEGIPVSETSDG